MYRYLRKSLLAGLASVAVTAAASNLGDDRTALIERGSYLVNAVAVCTNCHSPKDELGRPTQDRTLSGGGLTVVTPAFEVVSPNITPDPETGVGRWSSDDLKRAIIEGKRPANGPLANAPLVPIMYSGYYKAMTPRDLDAVVAYLQSVPPVRNSTPPPVYKSAFRIAPYPDAERTYTENDLKDPVTRGRYLGTLAHCMECHSGRAGPVADHVNALGKGGRVMSASAIRGYPSSWKESKVPNITPHPTAGIGAWTDEEIKQAITRGVSRDGRKLQPPMAYSSFALMTSEDLDAIVAWLRSIPPNE